MISVNELKNGVVIEYNGGIYQILEFQHVLQNKVAYVRVKMKNLHTGVTTETALKGSDSKFKRCYLDHKDMQYLYSSDEIYYFMDNETYEQIALEESKISWEKNFLLDGQTIQIVSYEGEILTINIPDKIVLTVKKADPAIKGNATDRKKVIMETGLEVLVPIFVEENDKIVISTIDGTYVSRA